MLNSLYFAILTVEFKQIRSALSSVLSSYGSSDDALLYKGQEHVINVNGFSSIEDSTGSSNEAKRLYFVDGGQAELLHGGSFCLTFIRVAAACFENGSKVDLRRSEFYVLTYAQGSGSEITYVSRVFGDGALLVNEDDLQVSSLDVNLRSGNSQAAISSVANMARRFAELELAKQIGLELGDSGFVVLDGILQGTYTGEEKLLGRLGKNVFGLAKSNSLFTRNGNNPCVLLGMLSPEKGVWRYQLNAYTSFVKLHPESSHVFRFEGKADLNLSENGFDGILSLLVLESRDPIFLGYPYGLVFVDKIARVSEAERKSLTLKCLVSFGNDSELLRRYLSTHDAHSILDTMG